MATRPRWVGFTVLVGGLFVVFVLLGRWQLHRADEQHRDDAVREAARSAPAVSVDHVTQPGTPPDSDNEWRAVTARGTYDQEHQLLVRNRSLNAKNGYLVLVPLQTDSRTGPGRGPRVDPLGQHGRGA